MKKIIVIVMSIAVAVMVGYGIKYVITPVNSQQLRFITQEDAINTNGFIIRDEWVMYTRSAGTVYHSVNEGERVAKDSTIGSVFYGTVRDDRIKELAVVDNKIKNARNDESGESDLSLDDTNVENAVYKRENDIIEAARRNDILAVSGYKDDINSLRQNNSITKEDSVRELEEQKERILADIGVANENITAQISGMFTTYIDGYETKLTPSDIENYDTAYFESLSQNPKTRKIGSAVDAGGEVCKIVNNHVWYVMMDIPSELMKDRKKGDDVKLRFHNMSDAVVDGTINSVSAENGGRVVVTVKCSAYLESAFSYRTVDADLIFESYDGYRIPIHAVHTDADGKQKVIGINSNKEYDCYCSVLFTDTDGGWAIVDSTEDAEHKLSDMERVKVGER